MTPQEAHTLAETMVTALAAMDPRWLENIRERLARGEGYDEWRVSFQRLIDMLPPVQSIVAKPGGEDFLRMLWQISRERAGASA